MNAGRTKNSSNRQTQPLSGELFRAGSLITVEENGLLTLPVGGKKGDRVLLLANGEEYRVVPLKPDVRKIYLELTTCCNFHCRTCIRQVWCSPLSHMPEEVLTKIEEDLGRLPELECVHLGGFGEPLLHPRWQEIVLTCKRSGLRVEIITNGSLLTADTVDFLIDQQVDMVCVSLDGPEAAVYEDVRKAPFSLVLDNVLYLQKRKKERGLRQPDLVIEFVAMRSNFNSLPGLMELADKLKARQVIVTNVLPYTEELVNEVLYDRDDTTSPFAENSPLITMLARLPYMRLRTDRYCRFIANRSLCINHTGMVSPCYALMHQYYCFVYGRLKEIRPFYVGDVREKHLDEIWTDPVYVNFRLAVRDFRFPSCADCRFLDGCSMTEDNEMDCWGNSPTCADCLWARQLIVCP